MISIQPDQIIAFRRKILGFYARHGRNLPFRQTDDPYKIAVAEIMLQQTQVERVSDKYLAWIKKWPDWKSLSKATNRQLLSAWSGLGYNRRALYLGQMARSVIDRFNGRLPDNPELLRALPGIGPYTANAILIFAFNKPLVAIDTNIRRAIIHELNLPPHTSKSELEQIAYELLPKRRSRDWHNALMDYSRLALPKKIATIPPLSRQSKFKGSLREIRGEIIRQLTSKKRVSLAAVARAMNRPLADVRRAAHNLEKDGLVEVISDYVSLRQ
jgi:A/G-specific adenine glycosylase